MACFYSLVHGSQQACQAVRGYG